MGAATATSIQQQQQTSSSKHQTRASSASKTNRDAAAAVKREPPSLLEPSLALQESSSSSVVDRPKRKATNRHIFRLLQTSNPAKAAEDDLMRALQASIELYPQYWSEQAAARAVASRAASLASPSSSALSDDSASCSSSLAGGSSLSSPPRNSAFGKPSQMMARTSSNIDLSQGRQRKAVATAARRLSGALNGAGPNGPATVRNRYQPIAKKNIYNDADFFHEGIMEYIEYELTLSWLQKRDQKNDNCKPQLQPSSSSSSSTSSLSSSSLPCRETNKTSTTLVGASRRKLRAPLNN